MIYMLVDKLIRMIDRLPLIEVGEKTIKGEAYTAFNPRYVTLYEYADETIYVAPASVRPKVMKHNADQNLFGLSLDIFRNMGEVIARALIDGDIRSPRVATKARRYDDSNAYRRGDISHRRPRTVKQCPEDILVAKIANPPDFSLPERALGVVFPVTRRFPPDSFGPMRIDQTFIFHGFDEKRPSLVDGVIAAYGIMPAKTNSSTSIAEEVVTPINSRVNDNLGHQEKSLRIAREKDR